MRYVILLGSATAFILYATLYLYTITISRVTLPMPLSGPSVTLRQGTYVGTTLSEDLPQALHAFRGIPYAQATSGSNRFRPPVAVADSDDVFDASHSGNRVPSSSTDHVTESEDSLNLNIFRPNSTATSDATKKKLPVIVYIYGGSFNFGSADGRAIHSLVAWSAEPMIGVAFNYRVGILGFLSCTMGAREGALNLGLKDQQAALQWIQDNIEKFGGDPENVTIWGTSAGGHSVGHHLLNAARAPLFSKVILESGSPTARLVYPYDHPINEQQFREFLHEVGASDLADNDVMPYLRSISFQEIKKASENIFQRYMPSIRWPWQPVIEGPGGIISIPPYEAWQTGQWHKVPIVTGFNTNEGAMFVPEKLNTSDEFTDFFRTLLPFSEQELATLNKLYPDPSTDSTSPYKETRQGLGKQYKRVEAAYGQFGYAAPARYTAHMAAAAKSPSAPPVWLYHFGVNKTVNGGCNHGDQIQHVDYEASVVDVSDTQKQIAGTIHAYFTSFIAKGDPNVVKGNWPDRPKWEAYGVGGRKMAIGLGNDEIAGGHEKGIVAEMQENTWDEKESEFWWSKVHLFEQKLGGSRKAAL